MLAGRYFGEFANNMSGVVQGGALASVFDIIGAVAAGVTAWLRVDYRKGAS